MTTQPTKEGRLYHSDFQDAARIVAGHRQWFAGLRLAFDLHPIVQKALMAGHRPADWHQLLLEWPHVSTEDATQVAYTRNEAAGLDFLANGSARQTRTSLGKYLSRHFVNTPDHVRRDLAAGFGAPDKYALWDTLEEIICGIELGPQSCMKSSYGSIPFTTRDNEDLQAWWDDETHDVEWHKHPYCVYTPQYGWRMAVRIDPSKPREVAGRALVNIDSEKVFVRSYTANPNSGGYSVDDPKLEAWLRDQGFKKRSSWPDGLRMDKLEHPGGHHPNTLLPYLDGDNKRVSIASSWVTIDCGGEYVCENTNGHADEAEEEGGIGSCDDCGATVREDDEDRIWAGRDEDTLICPCCAGDYTWVTGAGRRGTATYYIRDRDAVGVNGESYDSDNLPSNIVYCEDGEYRDTDSDDIVYLDGEWYECDDDRVCLTKDDGYQLKDDCWQCEGSGNWYSDSVGSVEIDSKLYHPDHAPETESTD